MKVFDFLWNVLLIFVAVIAFAGMVFWIYAVTDAIFFKPRAEHTTTYPTHP